mgnify:FL=1
MQLYLKGEHNSNRMENGSSNQKFTFCQVFHYYYFSFMLCNIDKVFYNGMPTSGFEGKIDSDRFTAVSPS